MAQTKRFDPHDLLSLMAFRQWVLKEIYEEAKCVKPHFREVYAMMSAYVDDAVERFIQETALPEKVEADPSQEEDDLGSQYLNKEYKSAI